MPPAAATECERTGWTLEMMATVAPVWAAARAARWPASPAPMISTSCEGTASNICLRRVRARRQADGESADCIARRSCWTVTTPRNTPSSSTAITAPSRPSDSEPIRSVIGRSCPTPPTSGALGIDDRRNRQPPFAGVDRGLRTLLGDDPGVAPVVVDHREPGPAVAQEVLVDRLLQAGLDRDRYRVNVHDVDHPDPLDPFVQRRLVDGRTRRLVGHERQRDRPQPDERSGGEQPATCRMRPAPETAPGPSGPR